MLDSDSVAYGSNPAKFGDIATTGIAFTGGSAQRWGRLVVVNAHGSELLQRPVPLRTQYYTSFGYIHHSSDSCTSLGSGDLVLTYSPPGLTTAAWNGLPPAGELGLEFTPPGAGNTGHVDIEVNLASRPWLRFDWPSDPIDGVYDDNPRGRVTFGIYAGNAYVIMQRERY